MTLTEQEAKLSLGQPTVLPDSRIVPYTKPRTKFEVSSSSSFGDMFEICSYVKNCSVT